MTKANEWRFNINYKSAKNGYHVTDADGTNCYFHNGAELCYLWYADGKLIKLEPGHAIFHPFLPDVFLNLNKQFKTTKDMPGFMIDNLKSTSSVGFI